MSVALWRRLLGADADLCNEFKWFSAKVIKPAVSEVNQVSNIIVTPEYRREGRYVKDIRFPVADNPQRARRNQITGALAIYFGSYTTRSFLVPLI